MEARLNSLYWCTLKGSSNYSIFAKTILLNSNSSPKEKPSFPFRSLKEARSQKRSLEISIYLLRD